MNAEHSTGGSHSKTALFLSIFGGVLLFLGWAGYGIWPLELVAFLPLWGALELVADRSWRSAFGVGWVYGTVAIAGGYHWMFEFSQLFSGFGTSINFAIFSGFCLYLGLQYGLQGALYSAIRSNGWGVVFAAIPSLVLTEWLFPRSFPIYAGNALTELPLLVQTADLGGPLLLSTLVAAANVAVFEVVRWRLRERAMPGAVVASVAALTGVSLIYGALRIEQIEARAEASPSLDVGIVQVNMGVFEKQRQMIEAHERHLEQSRQLEQEGTLDLLVWPESAYNYPRFGRILPARAEEVREDLQSPLLFGGLSVTWEATRRELYNSAYLVQEDALVGERYDKNRLVMFGEYLPFGDLFPRLYLLSRNTGMFVPGKTVNALSLGQWRLATPVCFEAILPGFIRTMVNDTNPHLLVNLTNDAWFGDTQERKIHLRLAQLRAVEHRRFLVRATNSGVSAFIDPVGRIVAQTRINTRENLRTTVHMMDGTTLYGLLGDWPGWLCVLASAFAFLQRRRQAVPCAITRRIRSSR